MADFADLMKLEQKPKAPSATQPAPLVSEKARKPENLQDRLPASPQVSKFPQQQLREGATDVVEKYSTRLKMSLIKRIKIYAAEQDCADYEVVSQAVEEFFSRKK